MRWSTLFAPTLRQVPADAEAVSHQLLLRAGFIRQLGAGIYAHLPLAKRSLLKIEGIVREEMNQIGAQEFHLPALNPAEIWKESGRWDQMGENMFRFKDRTGRDLCLGMTHEEVFTTIARNEIRSYRDLPQIWYQIQIKFRDEPRPKSGLLRVRQFAMKDSYSFDLDHSYSLHDQTYRRIFDRCGLQYRVVQASSGTMGGSESEEFVVFSEAGEDQIVHCSDCRYAANLEQATAEPRKITDPTDEAALVEIHTPAQKTIQEVSTFLNVPRTRQIKSLVYLVDNELLLVLLRGDHQLSESKLAGEVGADLLRPGVPEEIRGAFGADPGSLGPVGLTDIPILADLALKDRRNMICGANKDDFHLVNVTPEVDFSANFADIREVQTGDHCPACGASLELDKAMEIGHLFKLGLRYSQSMGATVLSQDGSAVHPLMGSYGIGVERILVAAAEIHHDDLGLVWPRNIAPFQVVITLVRPEDPAHRAQADQYCDCFQAQGVDCLLDDRDERPGVKFKDAELVGIPVRITIGKKLSEGQVELFNRVKKESLVVPLDAAEDSVLKMLEDYPL